MRKFAEFYPNFDFVPQVVALLPWGHNIFLLDKVPDNKQRIWYAYQIIENGWSRNILALQIEAKLYNRQNNKNKINNFKSTLPQSQSDLAHELLKDPYNFDFLTISEKTKEIELEQSLLQNLKKILLELGKGFAFIGEQYGLKIAKQDSSYTAEALYREEN